ncbi:ribonuclease HII [Henriciella litoralis]|uniref:ribonuclease HII n=1 Tax=Henriciella litoralis TaxID=568102 RepID=UPI000A06BC7C|nr:ribonuclease HII [Henriciella litoralis]
MICGVDEAGRGPWAGPVTAGAVILDPRKPIEGLTDSKKLTEARREALYPEIKSKALTYGIGWASPGEIDTLNIREATFLAMKRAIAIMGVIPDEILVDGNSLPDDLPCKARAIVKGDLTEPAISAASILAKVARDRAMADLEHRYPGYGFFKHKGYGTQAHSEALQQLGPCGCHRTSFAPVRRALETVA